MGAVNALTDSPRTQCLLQLIASDHHHHHHHVKTTQHLVVPDLDKTVVSARDQVRLVTAVVVIYTVDSLLVAFQGEVRRTWAQIPHLRQSTDTSTPKSSTTIKVEDGLMVSETIRTGADSVCINHKADNGFQYSSLTIKAAMPYLAIHFQLYQCKKL